MLCETYLRRIIACGNLMVSVNQQKNLQNQRKQDRQYRFIRHNVALLYIFDIKINIFYIL
jgi:hypothetical protein